MRVEISKVEAGQEEFSILILNWLKWIRFNMFILILIERYYSPGKQNVQMFTERKNNKTVHLPAFLLHNVPLIQDLAKYVEDLRRILIRIFSIIENIEMNIRDFSLCTIV